MAQTLPRPRRTPTRPRRVARPAAPVYRRAAVTPPADATPNPRAPRAPRPGGYVPSDDPARADDRVVPGGATYFEQAVDQHGRRLLAIARAIVGTRFSPEDVVQQALTNLYRHRDRYDWRQPGGLLKRATVNEALRLLRPPRMAAMSEYLPVADRRARPPESGMETGETVRRVRAAIGELPDHFRAALVLCEYEGMSYQQIAETLDCSIPQVKTWLHRARRKLAGMLEDLDEK